MHLKKKTIFHIVYTIEDKENNDLVYNDRQVLSCVHLVANKLLPETVIFLFFLFVLPATTTFC